MPTGAPFFTTESLEGLHATGVTCRAGLVILWEFESGGSVRWVGSTQRGLYKVSAARHSAGDFDIQAAKSALPNVIENEEKFIYSFRLSGFTEGRALIRRLRLKPDVGMDDFDEAACLFQRILYSAMSTVAEADFFLAGPDCGRLASRACSDEDRRPAWQAFRPSVADERPPTCPVCRSHRGSADGERRPA